MRNGNWTLVDKATNEPMSPYTPVLDFRNDEFILIGGSPPHKEGSTGRVYVRHPDDDCHQSWEFYPSVFNLVWKDTTNG